MSERWYDIGSAFFVEGRIKPYVRMTQRSMHVNRQAQEYLDSKMAIGVQLKALMDGCEMVPRGVPLYVIVRIGEAGGFHNRDLDNEVKAVLDAAQGIVFEDDRWIDCIHASRYSAPDKPGVWLTVVRND